MNDRRVMQKKMRKTLHLPQMNKRRKSSTLGFLPVFIKPRRERL